MLFGKPVSTAAPAAGSGVKTMKTAVSDGGRPAIPRNRFG